MKFEEYQKESRKTAIYPQAGRNYIYPTLGLAGETGEFVEKIKHILRDHKGKISNDKKEDLKDALGDVLWYLSQLASELHLSLEDIATHNLKKIFKRKKQGNLRGEH